jgi:hypothetical protein
MFRNAPHRNRKAWSRSVSAFVMDPHDADTTRILCSLAVLPECEQAEDIRRSIGKAIKQMPIYRVLELRERLWVEFDCENPTMRATLEMIDGQVALREIAGRAGWR